MRVTVCEKTFYVDGKTAKRIPAIADVTFADLFFDADERIFAEVVKHAKRNIPVDIDLDEFLPRMAKRSSRIDENHRLYRELAGWGYPAVGICGSLELFSPSKWRQVTVGGEIFQVSEEVYERISAEVFEDNIDGCAEYFRFLRGFVRWGLPVVFCPVEGDFTSFSPPTELDFCIADEWKYPWKAHDKMMVDFTNDKRKFPVPVVQYADGAIRGVGWPDVEKVIEAKKLFRIVMKLPSQLTRNYGKLAGRICDLPLLEGEEECVEIPEELAEINIPQATDPLYACSVLQVEDYVNKVNSLFGLIAKSTIFNVETMHSGKIGVDKVCHEICVANSIILQKNIGRTAEQILVRSKEINPNSIEGYRNSCIDLYSIEGDL